MGGKDGDTSKMDSKVWELQLLKVARWLVNPAGEEAFCIGAPWHGLCCVECRQDPMGSPEIIRLQVNDGGNCGNSVWMTRWWQATLERVFEKGSKYDLTKVSLEVSWRVKVVKTQGMILNGAHLSGDVSLDAWDVFTWVQTGLQHEPFCFIRLSSQRCSFGSPDVSLEDGNQWQLRMRRRFSCLNMFDPISITYLNLFFFNF